MKSFRNFLIRFVILGRDINENEIEIFILIHLPCLLRRKIVILTAEVDEVVRNFFFVFHANEVIALNLNHAFEFLLKLENTFFEETNVSLEFLELGENVLKFLGHKIPLIAFYQRHRGLKKWVNCTELNAVNDHSCQNRSGNKHAPFIESISK